MKISKENLIELDKLGVTQIKNVLSLDQCNEIIKQFDIEKAKFANLHVDELTCENRIWRAEHISKSVENVLSSDIVKHLSKKFNQKSEFAIVNHVWSGKGFGSGGGWHRDTRFGPQYKIIIYLTNCNQGNGEYWYIPKSHKIYSFFSLLKITELFRKPRYDKISVLLNPFARKFPGKAGDVIITNTVGLHRGSKVNYGERYALTIYFANGVKKVG